MNAQGARAEIDAGGRFAFGDNWRQFLEVVDEDRIAAAVSSLASMLGREDLSGMTFLDIGSGSGLFSLAGGHRPVDDSARLSPGRRFYGRAWQL